MVTIRIAASEEDFALARELFREYVLTPGVAELKRVYVRPEARGSGVGRELTVAILKQAQALRVVRLDTMPSMTAAIRLYESLGFRRTGSYATNRPGGAICYELTIA